MNSEEIKKLEELTKDVTEDEKIRHQYLLDEINSLKLKCMKNEMEIADVSHSLTVLIDILNAILPLKK